MKRSLVVIKPDGVVKGLTPEIIKIYRESEFTIVDSFYFRFTRDAAGRFYVAHAKTAQFTGLTLFMTSADCVALYLEGDDEIVSKLRALNGDWRAPAEGTIRQRFPSAGGPANIVHTSDSLEEAKREYQIVLSLKPLQEVSRR